MVDQSSSGDPTAISTPRTPPSEARFVPPPRRRRPHFERGREVNESWAPKWRRLLERHRSAPEDYTEFDRTVRGMLNRLSTANANRLLPLTLNTREASGEKQAVPSWWAARFALLMLSSYLQVIHTNRFARGLAQRAPDNVLPEYLDAIAPLLVQSSQVLDAFMGWLAQLLGWQDFHWPTTRLLLLSAREDRSSVYERPGPAALSRLPAELICGRILPFLLPSPPPVTSGDMAVLRWNGDGPDSAKTQEEIESKEKDVVAVLLHVLMTCPETLWPRVSCFAFALAEASLPPVQSASCERRLFIAASLLATIAQRIESQKCPKELQRHRSEDLGPLMALAAGLRVAVNAQDKGLSSFVACRAQIALDKSRRVEQSFLVPNVVDQSKNLVLSEAH